MVKVGDYVRGKDECGLVRIEGVVGWLDTIEGQHYFRFTWDPQDARRYAADYEVVSDRPIFGRNENGNTEVADFVAPLGATPPIVTPVDLRKVHGTKVSAHSIYGDIPTEPQEVVTLPDHYGRHPIEPIRYAVENWGPGFLIGNAGKYLARYEAKNGHEDLAKAARYLEMLRAYEGGDPDWYKPPHDFPLSKDKAAPLRSLGNLPPKGHR